MIKRNLGTVERAVRLLLALVLAGWLIAREQHDLLSLLAGLAVAALLLNAIFSRCYLWALLGIDTCRRDDDQCGAPPTGSP